MNSFPTGKGLALAALAGCCVSLAGPAAAAPCMELPVMLIVQDKSNSMWGYPSSACNAANPCDSKWTIASQVVPDVAAEFTGGFRYAMSMFPGDGASSNACSLTNLQQLTIGSDALEIQTAFEDATPAGATPTAEALKSAKDYLVANNAIKPSYVLLVTDGLPNCNASLDVNAATCTCTVPRVAGNPNCNTARCLDDVGTRAAAADLLAAGYPVYVVGFGAEVSADNNVAVLNAMAQAGGTTQAYITDNATGLYTKLRTIIDGVNNCCQDACISGATQCAPSETARAVCQMGPDGCLVWATESCSTGTTCNQLSGTCNSCTTTCTAGATQCLDGTTVRTCVANSQGCTSWQDTACARGSSCASGSCMACNNTCNLGTSRCTAGGSETCVADAQGCTSWSNAVACRSGQACNQATGTCSSCNGTCVAGARECTTMTESRVCVADALGCTAWQVAACSNGQTCGGGECASCNACTAGETRCAGNLPQSCVAAGNCAGWQSGAACGNNQVCGNGGCITCQNGCTAGEYRCNGNNVEICLAQPGFCNTWTVDSTCASGQQCLNGACCASSCTVGSVRCSANGGVEECANLITGCAGWKPPETCGAGEGCNNGVCLTTCELTGEGDTNCPLGFACQLTTNTTGFCVAVDAGSGGTSSSTSGFMPSRRDAGSVNGSGVGDAEDENTPTAPCGCSETSDQGTPAALGALVVLGMLLRRRR